MNKDLPQRTIESLNYLKEAMVASKELKESEFDDKYSGRSYPSEMEAAAYWRCNRP